MYSQLYMEINRRHDKAKRENSEGFAQLTFLERVEHWLDCAASLRAEYFEQGDSTTARLCNDIIVANEQWKERAYRMFNLKKGR